MKFLSAMVTAAGVAVCGLALAPETVHAEAGACQTAFGNAHTNNSRWSWTIVELSDGAGGDPYQAGESGNVFVPGGETWCVPVNPGGNEVWDIEDAHQPRLLGSGDDVKICQNSNIGSTRYSTITDEGEDLGYDQSTCTEITGYGPHPAS